MAFSFRHKYCVELGNLWASVERHVMLNMLPLYESCSQALFFPSLFPFLLFSHDNIKLFNNIFLGEKKLDEITKNASHQL